jgi:hypothetical protein
LLRVEIERFNIRVSLVEASFFRANLHHGVCFVAIILLKSRIEDFPQGS